MRQFLGALAVVSVVVLAVLAASPAEAADRGKKLSKAKLNHINWGRRSDITSRYWPFHQHPNVKIY